MRMEHCKARNILNHDREVYVLKNVELTVKNEFNWLWSDKT